MARFAWRGRDPQGELVQGALDGEHDGAIADQLLAGGVTPVQIQPATVIYRAPEGRDPRFYGWWGDMDFGSHFLLMLSARRQGRVEVIFHPEVPVDAFASRKELAAHCEKVIRASHTKAVSE